MYSYFPAMGVGFGLALTLIPPLGILVGLYFLARMVRALERIANHYDQNLR
jgi:TRAP-type C4-dicarboxylate transport system permease small subunit